MVRASALPCREGAGPVSRGAADAVPEDEAIADVAAAAVDADDVAPDGAPFSEEHAATAMAALAAMNSAARRRAPRMEGFDREGCKASGLENGNRCRCNSFCLPKALHSRGGTATTGLGGEAMAAGDATTGRHRTSRGPRDPSNL